MTKIVIINEECRKKDEEFLSQLAIRVSWYPFHFKSEVLEAHGQVVVLVDSDLLVYGGSYDFCGIVYKESRKY